MEEIIVKSTLDNTDQPSLFYFAGENRPLLVGLHTWSFDRYNQVENMLPIAKEHSWNLLLPEFRGPNTPSNPNCREACGSPLAIQDIFDAIEYVSEKYSIDRKNIFLLGASGGGHASLLAAAKNPELFRAVASFVPITDLTAWYVYSGYRTHIEACLGTPPVPGKIKLYKERSPISYVKELSRANLKIFHGRFDKVVPYMQSMSFYRLMCDEYPEARCFLDIFDGGHEMDLKAALYWFLSQENKKPITSVTG